ncbi:MAG: hypothetical protein ABI580_14205 [Burkholderiaceae bacterium]
MRQELIQHALDQGNADDVDANTIAIATARALRLLFAELEPLVGAHAVLALYTRSLHLARSSFERPDPADPKPPSENLASLQQDLAARAPADARRAGETLLHSSTDLLASLIGEPLTHRLLLSAWGSPAADELSLENPQ